jgi:hypothetical protein
MFYGTSPLFISNFPNRFSARGGYTTGVQLLDFLLVLNILKDYNEKICPVVNF